MTIGLAQSDVNRPFRVRWYHFYFLLAAVDLVVIAATLALYHQATAQYEASLERFSRLHQKQRWAAALRVAITHLNAPGNDVFETRRTSEEKSRFEKQLEHVNDLLEQDQALDLNLTEFRSHLNAMIAEERRIFELLEDPALHVGAKLGPAELQSANAAMAAMDRSLTLALTTLTHVEEDMLTRVDHLLKEYGAFLEARVATEKYFLGIMAVLLLAMFWYGGKLQKLYEKMEEDRMRVLQERTGRLAAVGEVCAVVSHGIRNPLAAISSSAQLARLQPGTNSLLEKRLDDILAECKQLDDRITRLLSFASSAAVNHEAIDFPDVVYQAIAEVRPQLAEKKIQPRVAVHSPPLRVVGDRQRLVQAAIEIISNSLIFAPAAGTIDVTVRPSELDTNFIEAQFADSGPGIPEALRFRVFEMFFSTRPGGTGIGLASVRHSIEACNGQVDVVQTNTGGTAIRILLPRPSSIHVVDRL